MISEDICLSDVIDEISDSSLSKQIHWYNTSLVFHRIDCSNLQEQSDITVLCVCKLLVESAVIDWVLFWYAVKCEADWDSASVHSDSCLQRVHDFLQ